MRRIWLVKPKRAYRKWRKPDGRPVPPLKEGIRCKRCREIIPVPPTMPPFICKGCLCGNPLAIAVGTRAARSLDRRMPSSLSGETCRIHQQGPSRETLRRLRCIEKVLAPT